MADSSPTANKDALTISPNGNDPLLETPRYCALCGREMLDSARAPERFGEVFCSEAHGEEFVAGVRAARVEVAAAATDHRTDAGLPADSSPPGAAKRSNGKMALKMAACCGIPMLALVVLAGGGAALFGAAGAALPLLATLACPLGMFLMMFFMMRGKMNAGQGEKRQPRDEER